MSVLSKQWRLPIEARATTGLSFATGGKCQAVDNPCYLIGVTAALQVMMHSHLRSIGLARSLVGPIFRWL